MKTTSLTSLEEKCLLQFLDRLKSQLGSNFIKAVLFGSRARGEGHEESDIDVLVLLKEVSLKIKHQVWDFANDIFLETGIDLSPLVMDESRLKRLQSLERLLAKQIEEEGIVL